MINQDVVLDLERLDAILDGEEAPRFSHLDEDVSQILGESGTFGQTRIISLAASVIGIIAVAAIAVLCVKQGLLGRTVGALSGLGKISGLPTRPPSSMEYKVEWILIMQYVLIAIALMMVLSHASRWLCRTSLSKLVCTRLSRTMPMSQTQFKLEINTLKHTVAIGIVSIHAPVDTLEITGGVPLAAIKVNTKCFGFELEIDWGTVTVTQDIHIPISDGGPFKIGVELPVRINVYDVNVEHLRHMLREDHRVDLLKGHGDVYTRHNIGYGKEPAVRRNDYPTLRSSPAAFRRRSGLLEHTPSPAPILKKKKKVDMNDTVSYMSYDSDHMTGSLIEEIMAGSRGSTPSYAEYSRSTTTFVPEDPGYPPRPRARSVEFLEAGCSTQDPAEASPPPMVKLTEHRPLRDDGPPPRTREEDDV